MCGSSDGDRDVQQKARFWMSWDRFLGVPWFPIYPQNGTVYSRVVAWTEFVIWGVDGRGTITGGTIFWIWRRILVYGECCLYDFEQVS